MRFSNNVLTVLSVLSVSLASPNPTIFEKRQSTPSSTISIPPPPAESTGCELHIDHYHCEGPAAVTASASAVSGVAPPPAESTGCVLHGDHYHCEGPASGHSDHDDNHDHDHDHNHSAVAGSTVSGSVSIPPPPTESVGCSLHGDHYHCEGPATSGAVLSSISSAGGSTTSARITSGVSSASSGVSTSAAVSNAQAAAGQTSSGGATKIVVGLPQNVLASMGLGLLGIFIGATAVF